MTTSPQPPTSDALDDAMQAIDALRTKLSALYGNADRPRARQMAEMVLDGMLREVQRVHDGLED